MVVVVVRSRCWGLGYRCLGHAVPVLGREGHQVVDLALPPVISQPPQDSWWESINHLDEWARRIVQIVVISLLVFAAGSATGTRAGTLPAQGTPYKRHYPDIAHRESVLPSYYVVLQDVTLNAGRLESPSHYRGCRWFTAAAIGRTRLYC